VKTKNHDCPLIRGKDDKEMKDFGDGLVQTEAQRFCLNCPLPECYELRHGKLTLAERGRLGGYARSMRVQAGQYGPDALKKWGSEGGKVCQANLKEMRRQFKLLVEQQNKEGARSNLITPSPGRRSS
jgi:hypothetical protein